MTKAEIQLIRSLDDKRARTEAGLFVVEGEKSVCELASSGMRQARIFHTGGLDRGERISPKEMERISHLKTPTGCLALFEIPTCDFDAASLRDRLVLALDDVQNPGNMGTIMRLADWFGIDDILCSERTADCFNPKVVQATMGAVARVRVHYGDLAAMISQVSAAGGVGAVRTAVYGTFLEGDDIYDAPLSPSGIIVLGSEGHGISPAIEKSVTHKLFIPPRRPVTAGVHAPESLNVAIAAAITVSEFRGRKF